MNSGFPIGPPTLELSREVAAEHVADEHGRCRACEPRGRIAWPCVDWTWATRRRRQLRDPTLEAPDPPAAASDEATTGGGAHRER